MHLRGLEMSTLNITLNPLAVDRLYEALTCLSKFGEYVTLEARRNKLILRTLNSTHSALVRICIAGDTFCDAYNFVPDARKLSFSSGSGNGNGNGSQNSTATSTTRNNEEAAFVCKIHVKALLPVFRGRYVQETVNKERDENLVQGIDKCEISLHERPSKVQCRLVVKMFCRHGVLKTYRLQYEEGDFMYATFRKEWGIHKWTIRAGELKKWMEHFGPKAEHLQITSEEDRAMFTSFSEKIVDGAQILKHPLQTAIELDTIEFNEFQVSRDTNIAISVKDFKALVLHAGTLDQVQISATYGDAGVPMQVTYDQSGMFCEFTLMTRRKGAAGPAAVGVGRAEPVAKIVTKAATSAANTAAGTRESSQVPVKMQGVSAMSSRASSAAPHLPSAPALPPLSSPALSAAKPVSRFGSTSAEMPPPPSRVSPRVGSAAAAAAVSVHNRESPISARQPSMSLRGSAPAQPRQSQSIFLMEDDDDDLFGPTPGGAHDDQFEGLLDDDDEDVLGWDASLGSERMSFVELQERAVNASANASKKVEDEGSFVAPTQRANVVKGLFDD